MTREFNRYRAVANHAGAAGAQAARALLDVHGLSGVAMRAEPGALTDFS